ncbi:hypothetical protein BH11PLA2_BH11PLA2_41470 [soil metagenome]
MAFVLRPPDEQRTLAERFRSLGQWRSVAGRLGAFGTLTAWLLGTVTLAAILDVAFTLPAFARATLLGTILAGTIVLLVRLFRSPQSQPKSLARLLEDRHPELNDVLATAASLEESNHPFHRATQLRAEKLANRIDFGSVVPTGRILKPLIANVLFALIATGFAITHDSLLPMVVARLLHPYGGHTWPARTRITQLAYAAKIARGDSFPLAFTISGEIPEQATVELRVATMPAVVEPVKLETGDDNDAKAGITFDPSLVTSNFEFRILANDADSGWTSVQVLPPPRLVLRDGHPSPQLKLDFPRYTQLKPVDLPDGSATVEAVVGTVITLNALADRQIKTAWLEYRGDIAPLQGAQSVAPVAAILPLFGMTNPFATAAMFRVSNEFTAKVPVSIAGTEHRELELVFSPPANGLYALRFTDADGITGQQLLDLRLFHDPTPTVTLIRPDPARDSNALLLTGVIPLKARAEDRIYGASGTVTQYRFGSEPWRIGALSGISGATNGVGGSRPVLEIQPILEVNNLSHDDGRKAEAGDLLTLRVTATDRDDVSILKLPGVSAEFTFKLFTPESLTADLERQLAAIRQPLQRATEAQKQAEDKLKEALDPMKTSEEKREALTTMEQSQMLARNMLTEPRDGLRAQAERLRKTAQDNQLPKSMTTARIDAVAKALERVDEKHLAEIENKLAEARQNPDDKASLNDIARHQKAVQAELNAAGTELERWAGLAELRSDLQALRDRTADLKKDANKLEERLPAGVSREQLTLEDRGSLDKLAAEQTAAADAVTKLQAKAGKIAEARRESPSKSPDDAALERATQSDAGKAAADELRKGADALMANRLRDANAANDAAGKQLKELEAELKPQTPAADELAKAKKTAASDIEALKSEQDELAKKSKAVLGTTAEQKALVEEQETLRRKTEQLAQRMENEGRAESAEQLRRAAEAMDKAAEEIAKGELPKPDESLQRLEEAKKKLNEPEAPKEELAREPQEDLAKNLKAFLERQKAAVAEFERLSAAAKKGERWDRPLIASLASLAEQEESQAKELAAVIESKLSEAPVFQKLLEQAASRMTSAASRLRERKDDALSAGKYIAETEAAGDAVCRKPMLEALRRLEQIVQSLEPGKPQPKPMDEKKPMPMGEPPMGPKKPGIGLPSLAQLKALRDWQADVNAGTVAFAKSHPDPAKLTDDQRSELAELQAAQQTIAKLFEALRASLQPPAEELP